MRGQTDKPSVDLEQGDRGPEVKSSDWRNFLTVLPCTTELGSAWECVSRARRCERRLMDLHDQGMADQVEARLVAGSVAGFDRDYGLTGGRNDQKLLWKPTGMKHDRG